MVKVLSAGLLMFCRNNNLLKVFLVHPGGPFFAKKDDGYWSIPKGLPEKNESIFEAARREFIEETGISPKGDFIELNSVIQKSGKEVFAWAFETQNDNKIEIKCNTFNLEWPPHSGKIQEFPEVDKGEFFDVSTARKKINSAQIEFINRLEKYLS